MIGPSRAKLSHEPAPERATDRRIARTRRLLHDALGALIRAKGYERITVGEILQRANVGRSTFYTHFRDKDDLLVSHIHDMLRAFPARGFLDAALPERIISFSLPFLEHIQHHRHLGAPKMGERGRTVLHEHVRRVLAERVIEDLRAEKPRGSHKSGDMEPELLAQYIASTFVLVLHWWMDGRKAASAAEADQLFRTLVLPALGAAGLPPRPSGNPRIRHDGS